MPKETLKQFKVGEKVAPIVDLQFLNHVSHEEREIAQVIHFGNDGRIGARGHTQHLIFTDDSQFSAFWFEPAFVGKTQEQRDEIQDPGWGRVTIELELGDDQSPYLNIEQNHDDLTEFFKNRGYVVKTIRIEHNA